MRNKDTNKWREAHTEIDIPSNALEAFDGFPSLAINDYCDYLESSGNEAASYVRKLAVEMAWAYDMWTKAQRDADSNRLMQTIYNDAGGSEPEYGFVRRFLIDFSRNNNIALRS
ncbi:MAG: hypothetical protein MN733_16365 [Nitrososphaera sp.]|nr:hypothetical protein [Nitrososphaera sp.]